MSETDISKLKREAPELYFEILNQGIQQERGRVYEVGIAGNRVIPAGDIDQVFVFQEYTLERCSGLEI